MLHWREAEEPHRPAMTVWALFNQDTQYFDPTRSSFMINYRVGAASGTVTSVPSQPSQKQKSRPGRPGRLLLL